MVPLSKPPRGNSLFFQALTHDWGPITTNPVCHWGKRYPLTGTGPVKRFYLGLVQDLTWPLNPRSTAVKRLPLSFPFETCRFFTRHHTHSATMSVLTHTHAHKSTTCVALNWNTPTKLKVKYSGIAAAYGDFCWMLYWNSSSKRACNMQMSTSFFFPRLGIWCCRASWISSIIA